MRKHDTETRYREMLRREERLLEEFEKHEIEWADDLLLWYKARNQVIPDDEYRAVAFFKNREWLMKKGSLALLYTMNNELNKKLPSVTRENAFEILCYRYRAYAAALEKGGF